ncbi:response regulator transcription factor (plasmid) [Bacillus thuringiensis]|uniref:response regulator transcription factor n=1 Tax=Bacillus thuringiensis TaxID=1428 RepID=UPI002224E5B6|nr:response regulator transcription factor [Bacillus thuringiensis]UYX55686.1 response regulator transcription factor [Bacillus thuringiensis]UYX55806.1 response regulator transcription factor [Bacillus thuringiensis]
MELTNIPYNSNIIIWSDQPIYRAGLKQILEAKLDRKIQDVSTYNELESTLLEKGLDNASHILLIDYETIEGRNFLLSSLKDNYSLKIIALSNKSLEEDVFSAMDEYDIDVYLLKNIEINKLMCVLETIEDPGVAFFHTDFTSSKLDNTKDNLDRLKIYEHNTGRPEGLLTNKEWDILEGLGKGYSNQQLTETFELSDKTIKNHVSSILKKLEVKDRLNAVLKALKKGWIKID